MMAYRLEFPPWEEVHARRLLESAEDFAELLTAHAHVSDAKVARSAFAIKNQISVCRTCNLQSLLFAMEAIVLHELARS